MVKQKIIKIIYIVLNFAKFKIKHLFNLIRKQQTATLLDISTNKNYSLFVKLGLNLDSVIKSAVNITIYKLLTIGVVNLDKYFIEKLSKKNVENALQNMFFINRAVNQDYIFFLKVFWISVFLLILFFTIL